MKQKKKSSVDTARTVEKISPKKTPVKNAVQNVAAKITLKESEYVSQKDFNNLANNVNQIAHVLENNLLPELDKLSKFAETVQPPGEEMLVSPRTVAQNPVPKAEGPTPTHRQSLQRSASQDETGGLGKFITPELVANVTKLISDFMKPTEQAKPVDPMFEMMQKTVMDSLVDSWKDFRGKINSDRQIADWVVNEIKAGKFKVGVEGGKPANT